MATTCRPSSPEGTDCGRRRDCDRVADCRRARGRARAGIVHRDLNPATSRSGGRDGEGPGLRSGKGAAGTDGRASAASLREPTPTLTPRRPSSASFSAPPRTWRRNRPGARPSIAAPTSGRSASSSSRCSRAGARSTARHLRGARVGAQDRSGLGCAAALHASVDPAAAAPLPGKRAAQATELDRRRAPRARRDRTVRAVDCRRRCHSGVPGSAPRSIAGIVVATAVATIAAMQLLGAGSWRSGAGSSKLEAGSSPIRLSIALPDGDQIEDTNHLPLAISRDGSRIAYVGFRDGGRKLFLRNLGDAAPILLAGTEGARMPFFSPDGQWIGFFTNVAAEKGGGRQRRGSEHHRQRRRSRAVACGRPTGRSTTPRTTSRR